MYTEYNSSPDANNLFQIRDKYSDGTLMLHKISSKLTNSQVTVTRSLLNLRSSSRKHFTFHSDTQSVKYIIFHTEILLSVSVQTEHI